MTEPLSNLRICQALRVLADYLKPEQATRHKDLILQEFSELVEQAPRSTDVLSVLISSEKHTPFHILESYLDRVGNDLLANFTDTDGDPINPIDIIGENSFAPAHRRAFFDRCMPFAAKDKRPRWSVRLLKWAAESGDPTLFDDVLAICGLDENDLFKTLTKSPLFENLGPSAAPFLEKFLGQADFMSEDWAAISRSFVSKSSSRSLAMLIASGLRPTPALREVVDANERGSWKQRFLYRMSVSSHAELKILSDFPSLKEVLGMKKDALEALMGGPDASVFKLRDRHRSLQKAMDHFAAIEEAPPEKLQRSYESASQELSKLKADIGLK